MEETLKYILDKYKTNASHKSPIEIPDMGRDHFPALFAELGFEIGAEIGVQYGTYSEQLCAANPSLKLFGVDPWKTYPGYRDHTDQGKLDACYENTLKLLAPYPNYEIIKEFSMDAVKKFEDESLDFVYIDGSHEIPWVLEDIYWWSKKVRYGGIVSGHDYYESTRAYTKCHVVYAVHCYIQSFRVNPWFLAGLKAKVPGLVRDDARSWFWVKQHPGEK